MNRNNKTSSLTEAAIISGILVIIAFLSSFFSIVMIFYPTPVIMLAKRRGLKYAALSLIAADLIICIFLGIMTGLIFFILYTPFALSLAYGVYKDEEATKTLLYGAASYMLSFVVFIFLMDKIMGINFVEQLKEIYAQSFEMMNTMISESSSGIIAGELDQAITTLNNMKEQTLSLLTNLFPAMIIMASVVISYINYLVAEKFARRFSINIKSYKRFSLFSFPKTFVIAMAGLLLMSFLLGALNLNVGVIQLNLFSLIFMAMLLQGFAVIKFCLERQRLSSVFQKFIFIMVIYMTFVIAGIANLVSILGLIDLSIDLRKLNKAV